MKLLFIILLIAAFPESATAQTVDCPVPEYFRDVVASMNRPIADVLVNFSQGPLKYEKTFRGDSDNPEWVFINFSDGKQQVSFVIIDGRAKLALLNGDHCSCIGEFEYLRKTWIRQGTKADYFNKDNTVEAIMDVDGDGGCLNLRVIKH